MRTNPMHARNCHRCHRGALLVFDAIQAALPWGIHVTTGKVQKAHGSQWFLF